MNTKDVAEHLQLISHQIRQLARIEKDENGPYHKQLEAWEMVWDCFEACALSPGALWPRLRNGEIIDSFLPDLPTEEPLE